MDHFPLLEFLFITATIEPHDGCCQSSNYIVLTTTLYFCEQATRKLLGRTMAAEANINVNAILSI